MNESAKHETQAVAHVSARVLQQIKERGTVQARFSRDAYASCNVPLYTAPTDGVRRGMEMAALIAAEMGQDNDRESLRARRIRDAILDAAAALPQETTATDTGKT